MLDEIFIRRRNVVWVVCRTEDACRKVLERVRAKFTVTNVEFSFRPTMPPVVSFSLESDTLRLEACKMVRNLDEQVQYYTHSIDVVPLRDRAALRQERDREIPITPLEEALRQIGG
jgi:hypothetical protein